MAFEEIETGELYSWDDPSDEIDLEGVLKDYGKQSTSQGEADRYEVETADGIIPFFAPSILHDKLQRANMGDVVKITFTETEKTNSGFDLKKFKVLTSEPTDEAIEAVGLDPEDVNDGGGFEEVKEDDEDLDF